MFNEGLFFLTDDGRKEFRPLLISCCGNEEQDHEKKLRELREILEECWEDTGIV